MYVASNSKLLLFLLLFLTGILIVEINHIITALVTIAVLGTTIATLVMKSICNYKELKSQVTTKRIVILFVSVFVGIGFINTQNDWAYISYIDRVIPFTLMTLFFIVILVNINVQKTKFFTFTNFLLTFGCAAIIRIHLFFDHRY
jgi:hypothetical protein